MFLLTLIVPLVLGHGFMAGLVDCDSNEFFGFVRNYNSISFNIDSLREPTTPQTFCRNTSPELFVHINSNNICVAIAFSLGAEHIGPCSFELLSDSGTIQLDSFSQCVSSSTLFSCDVPLLVTNDMCLYKLPIDNSLLHSGILHWTWEGQHVTPFEYYDNCIDINVSNDFQPTSPSIPSKHSPITSKICPEK
jgi:hypothetical protein